MVDRYEKVLSSLLVLPNMARVYSHLMAKASLVTGPLDKIAFKLHERA